MVIDCRVVAITVRATAFDVTPAKVAVMFVTPAPTPVATPPELMVATDGLEEVQPTELVRS